MRQSREVHESPGSGHPLRGRDVVVDVLVFVVVCLASFIPEGRTGHVSPHGLEVLPFMAASGAVLFARRRFPVVVLIACVLINLGGALLGSPHTPGYALPIAIAVYTVARYRSRALTLWLAGALIVTLPIEELILAGTGFAAADVAAAATLQPAVLVAFAAALGSAIRSYFDALESARERARRAEESRESEARRRVAEDRLAIARDLHDSVAHRIAVINLQAGVASRSLRDDPDEAEQAVAIVGESARSVLTELNEMLGLLRSSADRDIVDEPNFSHVEGLLSLFAKSGLKVRVHVDGERYPLGGVAGTTAYRVIQEALTNAYKHGSNRTADLELRYAAHSVTITTVNPAAGTPTTTDGHGLTGMRERLAAIGGTLTLNNTGDAFVLEAVVPTLHEPRAETDADRERERSAP